MNRAKHMVIIRAIWAAFCISGLVVTIALTHGAIEFDNGFPGVVFALFLSVVGWAVIAFGGWAGMAELIKWIRQPIVEEQEKLGGEPASEGSLSYPGES